MERREGKSASRPFLAARSVQSAPLTFLAPPLPPKLVAHAFQHSRSLNLMVPFIVAGVSVDDMIVIEDFFNKAEGKSNRMGEAMRAAGVAITITSMTSIVVFISGSWLDMPAVASFCMTCAFAFTWDFFLNVRARANEASSEWPIAARFNSLGLTLALASLARS